MSGRNLTFVLAGISVALIAVMGVFIWANSSERYANRSRIAVDPVQAALASKDPRLATGFLDRANKAMQRGQLDLAAALIDVAQKIGNNASDANIQASATMMSAALHLKQNDKAKACQLVDKARAVAKNATDAALRDTIEANWTQYCVTN